MIKKELKNYIDGLLGNLIQADFQLILNEVGAGTPVYNLLTSIPGLSSRKVIHVESNNNIDFTRKYNAIHDDYRLVSKETSETLAYETRNRVNEYIHLPENTCTFSNTVQISNNIGEKDSCVSHGYFSFVTIDNTYHTYHYTLPKGLEREEQILLIGAIGLDILNYEINKEIPNNGFIDYVDFGLDKLIDFKLKHNSYTKILSEIYNHNNAYVIDNGKIKRFNEIFRNDNKDIIIYKGSFNPVSYGHINTLKHIINKYNIKKENVYFCLTLGHRLDKIVTTESIVKRIELLNLLGYKVIVDTMPFFNNIYDACINSNDYNNQILRFPLGYDVFKKLTEDCADYFNEDVDSKQYKESFNKLFNKAIFHAFNRVEILNCKGYLNCIHENEYNNTDISSTKIRKAINNNDDNELLALYNLLETNEEREIIINYLKNNKNYF